MKILYALLFALSINSYSQTIFEKEPDVRVRIIESADTLRMNFTGKWVSKQATHAGILTGSSGEALFFVKEGRILMTAEKITSPCDGPKVSFRYGKPGDEIEIKDVPYGTGWWWGGREDRLYEGEISIHLDKSGKMSVVVKLPLEQYLKGVIPYEIGGDAPLEALKAQAVAARSEAVVALESGMYSGPGYDLTSDVECQVFSGNKRRTKNSDRAVAQTRGITLSEQGKVINAYYASNCGGASEIIKYVWPDRPRPATYIEARKDHSGNRQIDLSDEDNAKKWILSEPEVNCNPNLGTALPSWSQKNFRWKRKYNIDELSETLSAGKDYGKLLAINPLKRGKSGRIYHASFQFENGSFETTGELAIRMLFHPPLRSSCFIVDKTDSSFILRGAGWGHGVGMCQSGAVSIAKNGGNFKKILNHYYPEAAIINIYPEKK